MAEKDNNVSIGIPELYQMMIEIKKLLVGNGKPGYAGRLTAVEIKFWIIIAILVPLTGSLVATALCVFAK